MKKTYLKSAILQNYRNFSRLDIELDPEGLVLAGENGSGKTNFLEALSMLAPGKGLRKARPEDLPKFGSDSWVLEFLCESKIGEARIEISYDKASGRKSVIFNGSKVPASDLVKFLDVVWVTPQTDGIFLASPGSGRKFFDRIAHGFEHSHAKNLNLYEYYLKRRAETFSGGDFRNAFLDELEEKIADLSVKITEARTKALAKLSEGFKYLGESFPVPSVSLEGAAEKIFLEKGTGDCLEFIKANLKKCRPTDFASGRNSFGIHTSRFEPVDSKSSVKAENCSTGIQKALLVSIIAAQIYSIIKETGASPIALLDEIFVHLDQKRREYLINILIDFGVSTFITSTETDGFRNLLKNKPVHLL